MTPSSRRMACGHHASSFVPCTRIAQHSLSGSEAAALSLSWSLLLLPGAQGLHFKTRTQHHSIQFQLIKILLVETVYSLGKPKDKYFQSSGAYPNLRWSNDNEDNLYNFTLWLVRYFVKWKFLKNAVIWWYKFWNQLSLLWKNVNRIWF